ncbi:MAG TPA: phage Gp37/Gp68 family protein [Gammaproteobacteria bacterium]|nr:phage Gp37/Gp68 family protein [Gammaproteobacteria bacterium]
MSNKTPIEWTEQTWNPTTGCTKISAGCKHCYAETMSHRLHAMGTAGYEQGFVLTRHPHRLDQPLKRKKPTVYFVNSMSDLFHEHVPFAFIDQVMAVIEQTPQHTYQILTKRAARMRKYFRKRTPPINAWLGVSVENKKHGLPRIDQLRDIPATIRFLSVEPLLEDIGIFNLENIDWVIVGGESGPKARPMQPEWVANIKGQCDRKHVSFFFKQWGGWGADGVRRHKALNGRLFEGRTWDDSPLQQQPLQNHATMD